MSKNNISYMYFKKLSSERAPAPGIAARGAKIHRDTHTHTYIYIYIYINVCVLLLLCVYICIYSFSYIYIYTYIYIYIYIYIEREREIHTCLLLLLLLSHRIATRGARINGGTRHYTAPEAHLRGNIFIYTSRSLSPSLSLYIYIYIIVYVYIYIYIGGLLRGYHLSNATCLTQVIYKHFPSILV